MVDKGVQSLTLKSYVSAIKTTLTLDGYHWSNDLILLKTLTRACRLVNDKLSVRLPIRRRFLEMILFEVQRTYGSQPYLEALYMAAFALGYYGLFRAGELGDSKHSIKAKNVYIGTNKKKMLFILYSSKTHNEGNRPQEVKISAIDKKEYDQRKIKHFCPFELARNFKNLRGDYNDENENFLIFRDGTPVKTSQLRKVLRNCIKKINLNYKLYNFHSLRIGRGNDMLKFGYNIEEIKLAGRWKSNAVYKYIRN